MTSTGHSRSSTQRFTTDNPARNAQHLVSRAAIVRPAFADSWIRPPELAGVAVTDEASAMEWAGLAPRLVEGRADNLKVTRPEDLQWLAQRWGS